MFYHDPSLKSVNLLLLTRSFEQYGDPNGGSEYGYYGHAGLGVNAMHTVRVLRREHIQCNATTVQTPASVMEAVEKYHPTHCLIEVPWLTSEELATICAKYPSVHFMVRSHSQIGFLQIEPSTIKNLRDALILQEGVQNLTVAANSRRLAEFIRTAYQANCLYLPNLYDVERTHRKRDENHDHRLLRVGLFGALRLQKNHTTGAAAAMIMAKERNADLEIYISTGRGENSGKEKMNSVYNSLHEMTTGLDWLKLVEVKWSSWPEFRRTVSNMDIICQASMSETFNIVTADAIAEGVPAVVSEAIEWAPRNWQAELDSTTDIARTGSMLLSSYSEAHRGLEHLKHFLKHATHEWLEYLSSNPTL